MNWLFLILVGFFSGPPSAIALAPDTVVARANGPRGPIVITATRLRDFAASRPEASIEAALEALVDFELLAAEAEARGFASAQGVAFSRSQAMVAQYLMDVFEDTWSPVNLPEDAVKAAYRRVRGKFVHPPLRDANHILVSQAAATPKPPAVPICWMPSMLAKRKLNRPIMVVNEV